MPPNLIATLTRLAVPSVQLFYMATPPPNDLMMVTQGWSLKGWLDHIERISLKVPHIRWLSKLSGGSGGSVCSLRASPDSYQGSIPPLDVSLKEQALKRFPWDFAPGWKSQKEETGTGLGEIILYQNSDVPRRICQQDS